MLFQITEYESTINVLREENRKITARRQETNIV